MKEIKLEKIKFGLNQIVSKDLVLHDTNVELIEDFLTEGLAVNLTAHILGKRHNSLKYKYPKDWWQAFKERWFTKSMLDRWPVEYKRIVIDINELYPKMNISFPHNYHVIYLQDNRGDVASLSRKRVGDGKPLWE